MDIEKRRKADAKSKRKLYYPVTLRLHKKYDIDLIEQIKKQTNKRQYLMDLIRQDVKKEEKENEK